MADAHTKLVAVGLIRYTRKPAARTRGLLVPVGTKAMAGTVRPEVDVEVLKLEEELAPGHFSRCEIAYDDVGDERGADGVGGAAATIAPENSRTDRRKWRASWSSSITST